ncbi:MAG: MEDS domain-containing protein [Luteimonas sp.]
MYHACAFFSSSKEEDRVLAKFIGEGTERGHRTIHTVAPHQCAEHAARLTAAGVNVAAARANGRFRMQDWNVTHRPDGMFDPKRTLDCFERQMNQAHEDGFPLVSFVTHMEWALEGTPVVDSLLEYEALANEAWMRQRKPTHSVICVYDSSRFGADLLVDVMRTHPFTIVDGLVQENPNFVPPDEFLNELRVRRSGAPAGGLAPWQMRRIKVLLAANIEASMSVSRLAKECELSPRHFTRAFHHSTGLPPHRWILKRRMEMAKQLLRDPARSLLDVALACGFTDQSHFTRTFTARVGCSPSAWRRTQM